MKKLIMLLTMLPMVAMAQPAANDAKTSCGEKHNMMCHTGAKYGHMPFYLHGIELSDSQQAQLDALKEKYRDDSREERTSKYEMIQAIDQLVLSDDYDEDELAALLDKQAEVDKKRALARADFQHEVYQILTAEQREQLLEHKAMMKNKMRESKCMMKDDNKSMMDKMTDSMHNMKDGAQEKMQDMKEGAQETMQNMKESVKKGMKEIEEAM